MITVVAALIQQDGRLLICQRRRTGTFPLQWEFPGGKVKRGESATDALARELREELGIICTPGAIGRELYRTRHRYTELPDELELLFFCVPLAPGMFPADCAAQAGRKSAFERIEWVAPAQLALFDFLAADRELVRLLASGAVRLP